MNDTVINIAPAGGSAFSVSSLTDTEVAALRTRLSLNAVASLVASLSAGDNTVAGSGFSPTLTSMPHDVIVLLDGVPQDVSWSATLNGSNYDLSIYTTEALTNVTIIVQ